MMKLGLDSSKIGKDVSMIELEVVQNCRPRPVMDELGAFVAERRVVLIRLDDEEG